MNFDLVLASSSEIRARMLRNAGLSLHVDSPRVDEENLTRSLMAEDATPRDIADALAEAKARKVSGRFPNDRVLGCDQVLECDGTLFSKPQSRDEARTHLQTLRNKTHRLLSAAVLYHEAKPVWRYVGVARLTMRDFDDRFIDAYLDRNWPEIASSVGGYTLETEGVRLFARIAGDHFTIFGLPLIELLNHLALTGAIDA